MQGKTWRWILGMVYVVAVAVIWIIASFVVQSVVSSGASPFLLTYICNTLFVVYIPLVEVGRLSEFFWHRLLSRRRDVEIKGPETENLLDGVAAKEEGPEVVEGWQGVTDDQLNKLAPRSDDAGFDRINIDESPTRIWTRTDIARISLLICPVWFIAQYTYNLSLKYTTVTSNTVLSSTSSLFTYLMSVKFLEENFTWLKLWSVLLCTAGTILVGFSDSEDSTDAISPVWGDVLCVLSAFIYAIYTTLLRKKLPDETKGEGRASTALFFGFLGLFNGLLLLPIALILNFTGVEAFDRFTLLQIGLIIGKGLLDNVFSDYLWAKAVLLTTTTAATTGLTIQVPIAAIVDSIRGVKLGVLEYVGGIAILIGFFGINKSADGFCSSPEQDDGQDEGVLDTSTSKETILATS